MRKKSISEKIYGRVYDVLRRNGFVNYFFRKVTTASWLEDNPIYQYLYWRRIKGLIKKWAYFPPVVLVGITNICNSRCRICPIEKHPLPKGIMTVELFERIIKECHAMGVQKIILSGGEPLLDQTLVDKIILSKKIAQKVKHFDPCRRSPTRRRQSRIFLAPK